MWTSTGNLWWVDILGRRVHCFDPVSRQNTTVFQHPEQNVVFVVEASAGEMVVGLGKTIHRLANGLLLPDPVAVLVSPGESRSLNDAAVDPLGNLWVGVYEPDHIPGAGSLWRITPDGQTTAMVQGLTLPNGVAFTTDGSRLYLADSFQHSVFAFELDLPSGQIGERRTIWFDPDRGFPDGLCIDLDGNLWVAFWGDSCVRVIQPNGNQLDEVRFPVTQVSSCALGDDG